MCIYIIIYIFMYHLSRIILGGKASISPYCIHKLYQFSGWGVLLRHLERGVIAELLPLGAPLEFFSQKAREEPEEPRLPGTGRRT